MLFIKSKNVGDFVFKRVATGFILHAFSTAWYLIKKQICVSRPWICTELTIVEFHCVISMGYSILELNHHILESPEHIQSPFVGNLIIPGICPAKIQHQLPDI
jgi:hypothetical protein